jgi:hypothetical protein
VHSKKGEKMRAQIPKTVSLGELILAVFDTAAKYSADPREVSRLAMQTISHMLRQAPRLTRSRYSLNSAS